MERADASIKLGMEVSEMSDVPLVVRHDGGTGGERVEGHGGGKKQQPIALGEVPEQNVELWVHCLYCARSDR